MSTDRSSDATPAERDDGGQYVVVARRYRPRSFEELVGQQQVSQALRNAIATNRVGHAYLFTGARGVGKTSTARILAKCLNCADGPTAQPCGQCDACVSIAGGDDIDVLEIDGASNRGIDEIRQLRSNVNVRPSRSRFKIYIIDEVHMLTVPAFNALLKTLEEPPEHVKFVFCTTDPEKIPITVLSRCQRFDFAPVATESIHERLRFIVRSEGAQADDAALQLLARRAGGSMRDSQSLLEQLLAFCGNHITETDVHAMLGTAQSGRLAAIAERLLARDTAGALAELDAAVQEGVDVGQLLEQLLGYFRDMMAAVVGCQADLMLYSAPAEHERLRAAGQQWGLETILAVVQIVDHTIARMRQSMQSRTLAEIALVRICSLEDLDDLTGLIGQLRGAASDVPAAVAAPAPRRRAPAAAAPVAAASRPAPVAPTAPAAAPPATAPAAPLPHGAAAAPPVAAAPAQKKTTVGAEPPVAASAAPSIAPLAAPSIPAPVPAPPPVPDSPRAPGPAPPLAAEQVGQIWKQALDEIGGMTADFAGDCLSVTLTAPNQVAVELKAAYNKEWCDRPEVKQKLEQTLGRLAGQQLRVEFRVSASAIAGPPPMNRREALQHQRRKMRELENHPLVQTAMQLFDAEVVQWDVKQDR